MRRAAARFVLISSLILCSNTRTFVAQEPPPGGRISGQVRRADTGAPIEGASVRFMRVEPGASTASLVAAGREGGPTQTDDQGRYAFDNMRAGEYAVFARRSEYFALDAIAENPEGYGRHLRLAPGQRVLDVDLLLVPGGAIEGLVTNGSGKPTAGIRLLLTQPRFVAGSRLLAPVATARATDAQGRFSVTGMAPGEYYLLAVGSPFGIDGGSMLAVPAEGPRGFAPTYYPGTRFASQALPIRVAAGETARDVTIALIPSAGVRIAGRVVEETGLPATAGVVQLLQTEDSEPRPFIPANVAIAADGSFAFAPLPSGTYVLQARTPKGFGSAPLVVDASDQNDIVIKALPPRVVRGRVSFESGSSPSAKEVQLWVTPTDFLSGPVGGLRAPDAVVHDDGTFELPGVQHTGVLWGNAGPRWLPRSVKVGGRDVTGLPYDFRTRDVSDVEIVFSNRWATVQVAVRAGDKPVSDCIVVVFPQDPAKWTSPGRYIRAGRTDQQGNVVLTGLPAGLYFAVSLSQPLAPGVTGDPAVLKDLRGRATVIRLDEGVPAALTLSPPTR